MGGGRGLIAMQVLVLCFLVGDPLLVHVGPVHAADTVNDTTAAGTKPAYTGHGDLGNHWVEGDEQANDDNLDVWYSPHGTYRTIVHVVGPVLTAISLEMIRIQVMQAIRMRECTASTPSGVFTNVGKAVTADGAPIEFTDYTPVLVSGLGNPNGEVNINASGKVRIVPYETSTRSHDGFIAMLISKVENIPNNNAVPMNANPLLVAVDCNTFNESDTPSMEWHEVGLNSMVEDLRVHNTAATLTFFDLNPGDDSDFTLDWEYCPRHDHITIVTYGTCKAAWPHGYSATKGIKEWLQQYSDDEDQKKKSNGGRLGRRGADVVGKRLDIGIRGSTLASNKLMALGMILVIVAAAFSFTFYSALDSDLEQSVLFLWPQHTIKSGDILIACKILSAPIVIIAIVLIRAAIQQHMWNVMRLKARKGESRASTVGASQIAWWMKVLIVVLALYLPMFTFFTAKYINNTRGRLIKSMEMAMSWINYELAILFFAKEMIEFVNHYAGYAIPQLISDHTGDMILAFTGLTSALLDLVGHTRDGHGMNDGCDLEELGLTLRKIARNTPEVFPSGASMEMYCAESNWNFSTIFNSSFHEIGISLGLPENRLHLPRFDDGNMCNLVCSLPQSGATSSFPIWCKDNGFAGARWTLSSLHADLAPRLCPSVPAVSGSVNDTATNATGGNVRNDTRAHVLQATEIGVTVIKSEEKDMPLQSRLAQIQSDITSEEKDMPLRSRLAQLQDAADASLISPQELNTYKVKLLDSFATAPPTN